MPTSVPLDFQELLEKHPRQITTYWQVESEAHLNKDCLKKISETPTENNCSLLEIVKIVEQNTAKKCLCFWEALNLSEKDGSKTALRINYSAMISDILLPLRRQLKRAEESTKTLLLTITALELMDLKINRNGFSFLTGDTKIEEEIWQKLLTETQQIILQYKKKLIKQLDLKKIQQNLEAKGYGATSNSKLDTTHTLVLLKMEETTTWYFKADTFFWEFIYAYTKASIPQQGGKTLLLLMPKNMFNHFEKIMLKPSYTHYKAFSTKSSKEIKPAQLEIITGLCYNNGTVDHNLEKLWEAAQLLTKERKENELV